MLSSPDDLSSGLSYSNVCLKPVELLETPESPIRHSIAMKHAQVRRLEKNGDWTISSQAANSGRFRDYPIRE